MVFFTSQISILLFSFLLATTLHKSVSSNHEQVLCNEKDRGTLLIFKRGIIDPLNRLSSWSNEVDCCAWEGVQCENITGRVTNLDLTRHHLEGELNLLPLLGLQFLSFLDLSFNDFDVLSIPPIRSNITLGLNLGHLSLAFSGDHLHMDNLLWLSQLSSLKYLDLSLIDLHKETNWLQLVAMLPSLSELIMNSCNLNNFGPPLKYANFTSLVTLDLSFNNFNTELPYWLFNITSNILELYLSNSKIQGKIPPSLLNLRNLKYLSLYNNQLIGSIPEWIGQLEHLNDINLSYNMLSGSIPLTLGNLSSLYELFIGSNSFSNAISEKHLTKLSNLVDLDLSNLTISFQFDPEWFPPFQLDGLYLSNTNQGPGLLSWIYTQKSLHTLDISKSGISFISNHDKFWSFVSGIPSLDLSSNSISGDISNVTLHSDNIILYDNNFTGDLPHLSPDVSGIDLSQNSFSGPIPNGWTKLEKLTYINLWSNNLSGEVPANFSNLALLNYLNLGKNELSGTIPIIMSQKLQVMVLRSNQFEGNIPPQTFNLSYLYHLDLAHNKLSGSMPHGIYNLTQMITYDIQFGESVAAKVDLYTKGQAYEYNVNPFRRTIDLSVNNLTGGIPLELFRLVQVQTLNLSHNHFTGTIHKEIGDLKNLESLDFSNNKLSGEIPQSMADMSFLGYLNLSYNNFAGQIPVGTQLQSFDASSYIGNPNLCGTPLKKCFNEEENSTNTKQHAGNYENGDPGRESLYLGMGVGFAVGFWVICGSLVVNRKWRDAYYRFLDRVIDTFMIKIKDFRKTKPSAS